MTTAGYSDTPTPENLGIKDGSTVATIAAPRHFADLLAPLPGGVRIRSDRRTSDLQTKGHIRCARGQRRRADLPVEFCRACSSALSQ